MKLVNWIHVVEVNNMDIGSNIKKIRKLHKLTSQQLSEIIGITRSQITKIETGVSQPSVDVLQKIANAFNITVSELIGEKELTLKPELRALLDSARNLTPEQVDLFTKIFTTLK